LKHDRLSGFDAARIVLRTIDVNLLDAHGLIQIGVGVKVVQDRATDEPCIKAFVRQKLPLAALPPRVALPTVIPGTSVRTDVEEMAPATVPPGRTTAAGRWEALWLGNRARHRPILGGDSVSHEFGILGTVGGVAIHTISRATVMLSCNHVLARLNRGRRGDPIVQPAFGDGGAAPRDICASLLGFVPVRFEYATGNRVDAAIAQIAPALSAAVIEGVGPLAGVREGNSLLPGERVYKVGRTTGLTSGTVVAVHVSGWLSYPPVLGRGGYAFFQEQVVTTAMAGFGDSGALVIDDRRRVVGLLFGGSSSHTLFNDIVNVQEQLGIRVVIP
jgi:hypothetical protein